MANIRPLAYTSEVGEAFRPLTSSIFVKFLYGVSWSYIFLDTGLKVHKVNNESYTVMSLTFFDTFTWHIFASMVLPAITIHAIVDNAKKLISKRNIQNKQILKFGPTLIGLSSIPLIIHPLDHFTDYLMDYTFRMAYSDKLPKKLGH